MAIDALSGKITPACWSRPCTSLGEETRVWSRSALQAELLRVLGVVDAANQDVSRAARDKKITPEEWQQWRAGYLAAHQFLTSASPSWGSNAAPAHEWEQYAAKWRDFVESRGGKLGGPRTERQPETSAIKVALAGGLAVGGALALAHLVNSVRR